MRVVEARERHGAASGGPESPPEVQGELRSLIAELREHPQIKVSKRKAPRRKPEKSREVLEFARTVSGLSIPDAWLPLCAETPLKLEWKVDGKVEGGCWLWPLDDSPDIYAPPLVQDQDGNRIDFNQMPPRGEGCTPYDEVEHAASGVVMRAEQGAEGPQLWYYDYSRAAWQLDLSLPDYLRCMRRARAVHGWQRLYCPFGRNDDGLGLLSQTLDRITELFGPEAVEQMDITANSSANLARLRELREMEGWPEQAHHLIRQPVLVVSLSWPLVQNEPRFRELAYPRDGAFYVISPLVEPLTRFEELEERGSTDAREQDAIVTAVLDWLPDEIFRTYEARTVFLTPVDGQLPFSVGFHDLPAAQLHEAFADWGFSVYTEADLPSTG